MPAVIDFDSFHATYEQAFYAYARKRVKDHQEAQDVVQTVFLRLSTRTHLFKDEGEARNWCYTVARNQCIDLARQGWNAHVLPPDEDTESLLKARVAPDNTEDAVVRDETLVLFHKAFAQLPAHYQRCLRLMEWEGLGTEQIASITGENRTTIKSRAFRARQLLKEIILSDPELQALAA